MKEFKVSDILNAIDGTLVFGNSESLVTGVSTDTRTIKKGQMFFALEGENYDGHKFVKHAIHNGAVGAVVSGSKRCDSLAHNGIKECVLIEVADTIRALGDLAAFYRNSLQTRFIAVTGSNGKTTTKEMIYHVLKNFRRVTKSRKSFNNYIGVPLSIFETDNSRDYCVVEMGTNAPGEIKRLSEIISPEFVVLTNISRTHLEGLGSIEGVANAKAECIENMAQDGTLIINADDDWCKRIVQRFDGRVVSFGFDKNAHIRASDVKRKASGFVFTVNDIFTFSLSVPGKHNIYNALAVIAMCNAVGISMGDIAERLIDYRLPSMRMEKETCGDITVINDGYNSNPSSMSAALEELSQIKAPGRRVVICGDMLELGTYTERLHKEIGEKIAGANIDLLWTVGTFSRFVAEGAIAGGMPGEKIQSCETSEEMCSFVPLQLKKDDIVLIKGSRKMKLEVVLHQIRSCFSMEKKNRNVTSDFYKSR